MAAEELDEEERALVETHRAERRKQAEDDKEVWIKQGDNEAAVPFSQAAKWLKEKFGIGLDEEPVQEPPEKPKPDDKPAGEVKRFVSGRRVG